MATPEARSPTLHLEQVSEDLRRIFSRQTDIGAARILADWFFDPPNVFDPNSRSRPKPGILILLSYVLLMTAVCAAFNFR